MIPNNRFNFRLTNRIREADDSTQLKEVIFLDAHDMRCALQELPGESVRIGRRNQGGVVLTRHDAYDLAEVLTKFGQTGEIGRMDMSPIAKLRRHRIAVAVGTIVGALAALAVIYFTS
jgi:hypothetical protein